MTFTAAAVNLENRQEGEASDRPPGSRGAEAARILIRMITGRPLEACASLFARYGDAPDPPSLIAEAGRVPTPFGKMV